MSTIALRQRACDILDYMLRENDAYALGHVKFVHNVPRTRKRLATVGQAPYAAVIACADSRVSPEIIFRASLGEIFVIRTAGNTATGWGVQGSLEYAIDHLNVPLVLVLGHTCCGAVGAACTGGDILPGALGELIHDIAKGIESQGGIPKNNIDLAVQRNVQNVVRTLRKAPGGCVVAAEQRGVVVCGAVYDIMSGKVSLVKT